MHENGRGVSRDDAAALFWYRKAADRGHADAQCKLGVFYHQGRGGLPKDEREAARLLQTRRRSGRRPGAGRACRDCTASKSKRNASQPAQTPKAAGGRNRRSDAASSKIKDVTALEILGLKAAATEGEIRTAYRVSALKRKQGYFPRKTGRAIEHERAITPRD